MIPILLGKDKGTRKNVYLDPDWFRTHCHFCGATGTGKSTALMTILQPLMMEPRAEQCCLFLIDPIGNLSRDMLRFIAHPKFCPEHVRRRLVYIEPANEEYVTPFNPLGFTTEASRYYQTMRSMDIVLRAWAAQDLSQQPRLMQWTYKAFCAAASMGFPISMCRYLLHPGSDEHKAMLAQIPGEIQHHWKQILNAHGSEAVRILESTRNRLDPFFESPNLRRMFGVRNSRFDCARFIKERKIVILNLGKYGRIPGFVSDTIGALALNEIMETANRLSTDEGKAVVDPTYIVMDEFQRFVSVDVEDALPTVRQMGLRLFLAHQSFAQLEREDVDLTQMIWQARARLIFANNAKDADILADELAKLTFDSMRIKDKRESVKQLIRGYRKEWLESESSTSSRSASDTQNESIGYNQGRGKTLAPTQQEPTESTTTGDQKGSGTGRTLGESSGETRGRSQANVPIHETLSEVSSVTFESFDEWSLKWGQKIRRLRTGEAFTMFPNSHNIREVQVDHHPLEDDAASRKRIEELMQRNYESDFFISTQQADNEIEECRKELLSAPPLRLDLRQKDSTDSKDSDEDSSPFN